MIANQNYLVTREVVLRTGQHPYKYRTQDGRYVIDTRTLRRINFTTEEFLNGIQGIEPITEEEAHTLIAKNGYVMGDEPSKAPIETQEEPAPEEEEQTPSEENNEPEASEEVEGKTTKKGKK